jgi:MFS family permease
LLIFLLLPHLGKAIDRNSRKKVLVFYFVFGIGTNLLIIAMILLQGRVEAWHLVTSISLGSLGVSVYYPAQFAFNQEVLAREQYSALSGAIEVQCTFAAGLVVLGMVPYRRNPNLDANVRSAWKMMFEGLTYLRIRPRLSLVIFGSFLPFLGIMIVNYLTPVFVKDTLQAGPEVYGFGEVFYSLGAVLAGLTIPRMTDRIGLLPTLLLTVGCFTGAVAANPLFPGVAVLLGSLALQGWGNAGSRVARSTLTLETVPNELMGRVNLFYGALERLLRSIFLAVVTQQVATTGAKSGYWTVGGIGAFAWITILCCRRFRHRKVPPPVAIEKES